MQKKTNIKRGIIFLQVGYFSIGQTGQFFRALDLHMKATKSNSDFISLSMSLPTASMIFSFPIPVMFCLVAAVANQAIPPLPKLCLLTGHRGEP